MDALAELFDRYRVPVYRAALALTGDPGASEEVLLDTFGRAYTHRRRLRTDVSPLPWLHKVALNLCYSRLGRRRLRSEPVTEIVAERLVDGGARPDTSAEWSELCQIVREGIAGLSPKHQSVVILYYLEGRSLQETADALGLPLGTVKSRIHHALQRPPRPPERRPPLRGRVGRGRVRGRGARRPVIRVRRLPPAPHRPDRLRRSARARAEDARRPRPPRTLRALRAGDGGVRADDRRAAARRSRARGRSRALRRRGAGRPADAASARLVVAAAGRKPAHLCGDRGARGPAPTPIVDLARRGCPVEDTDRRRRPRGELPSHAWRRGPTSPPWPRSGTMPPRYPDGLIRPWKEVPATDATQRGPEPS